LHGRVLEGMGRADVVVDAVPFVCAVDVGSPTMAVTPSVVEDAVVVALRPPEMTVGEILPDREARFDAIIGLLG
jgi:hypothetical protein